MSAKKAAGDPVADHVETHDENEDEEEEEEWESDDEGEVPSEETIKNILKLGEDTNTLLKALLSHPKSNRTDPSKSPKPLFFAADFIRRTYLDYLLPIIPREAAIKSSRFANPYIFGYPDSSPMPTEPADDYLNNPDNWSRDSSTPEMYMDAIGRKMMICLAITDDDKGPMMLQGQFDWVNPVDIKSLAQTMLAD